MLDIYSHSLSQIKGYKIHKLYSTSNYNCDIGLVRLNEPVDLTKAPLNPICLAEKGKAFIGEDAVVAGWGATSEGGSLSNKLLQVEVPVWSNAECKMSGYGKNRITDNMLCAGFKEGGKDACQGEEIQEENEKLHDKLHATVISLQATPVGL